MEALTDAGIREEMQETTNIFRVLIKTLLKAGIITDRTRGNYAAYIDMAELYAEGDRMVGDDIAEEGIKYLIKLNGGKGSSRLPPMRPSEDTRDDEHHQGSGLRRGRPAGFPGDARRRALRPALDGLRQDHLGHARSFLGSARQEIHRFLQPFDLENEYLVPPKMNMELQTAIGERSTNGRRSSSSIAAQFSISSILHGEQGALALSASLCHILRDPGAQEYAANQTREEARHVTAFAKYIQVRWGKPVGVGSALGNLLIEMVGSPDVWKKARRHADDRRRPRHGRFASFYTYARIPASAALPAGDDRRSLPPQIRKDLGRPHDPKLSRTSATRSRTGRPKCSSACCAISAARPEARSL
jgi:hypothetical protein